MNNVDKKIEELKAQYGEFSFANQEMFQAIDALDVDLYFHVMLELAYVEVSKYETFDLVIATELQSLADLANKNIDADDAESYFFKLVRVMAQMENHILIGRELGFTDKETGIYDAMTAEFEEAFQPSVLKVARDYCKWFKTQNVPNKDASINERVRFAELCWEKYRECHMKNTGYYNDEQMIACYLIGGCMGYDAYEKWSKVHENI